MFCCAQVLRLAPFAPVSNGNGVIIVRGLRVRCAASVGVVQHTQSSLAWNTLVYTGPMIEERYVPASEEYLASPEWTD